MLLYGRGGERTHLGHRAKMPLAFSTRTQGEAMHSFMMPTLGRMLAIAAALVTIVALSLSITASASAARTDEEPERVLVAEGV